MTETEPHDPPESSPTDASPDEDQPSAEVSFSPSRLSRELGIDAALRAAALVVIVLALLTLIGLGGSPLSLALSAMGLEDKTASAQWVQLVETIVGLGVVVGLWLWLSVINAKVAAALAELTVAIDRRPEVGEAMLAKLLARRGLTRWARLMLYHRLAVLRHRQQRYAEAAAVAQTVLVTPRPGPAARGRAPLLLLLVEARLELHDPGGAYLALVELSRTPVGLTEALQRLALRTRYELAVGHDAAVLYLAEEKVRLAELMPGPQCGAFHALLAIAAERGGDQPRHRHWWQRVELLCSPEQVQQIERLDS